jgi:hypothetical protein
MRGRGLTVAVFVAALSIADWGMAAVLDCPNTLRVSVLADGSVVVNGATATLEALDARLVELTKSNGSVWYYRENAGQVPSAGQDAAIKNVFGLIIKHRRPVSLSSRADFSDVIDGDGNSSPRTKC